MNLLRLADAARDITRLSRVPALPATATPAKPNRGATTTNLSRPQLTASMSNAPSMKISALDGGRGGVEVVIRRNARFAGIVDKGDVRGMQRLADEMIEQMKNQSQGTLSLKQLRKMGHPYGRNASGLQRGKIRGVGNVRGVRGSVPNLTVVNKQSGAFAGAWKSSVDVDESGVTVRLINTTPYAAALALGTRRMVAHGPFSSVVMRYTSRINSEWQKAVRGAYNRKSVEMDLAASLGT